MKQELTEVSTVQHYPLGTVCRLDRDSHRYARAGQNLIAEQAVYVSPTDRTARELVDMDAEELKDRIWGAIKPTRSPVMLGFAVVDVPEGHYCWVREQVL